MKNVFITGITGQDGIFLTSEIVKNYGDVNIVGTSRSKENPLFFQRLKSINSQAEKNLTLVQLDLRDQNQVMKYIDELKPDYVINLSGPSSVYKSYLDQSESKKEIELIFDNLVDSLIKTDNLANFFQSSSSEMFANSNNSSLDESSLFLPRSPYAIAKLRNHEKVLTLRHRYDWSIYSGIMFNHESQFRSEDYLFMKVINTAKNIKNGANEDLIIGSLDYIRDWCYSKDTVKAILSIIENGKSGSYVIGSGKGHKISDLIEKVFSLHGLNYMDHVKINNSFLRKGDPRKIVSNPMKIKKELGWQSETTFEKLIEFCINT